MINSLLNSNPGLVSSPIESGRMERKFSFSVKSVRFRQPEIEAGMYSSLLLAKSAMEREESPPIVLGSCFKSFVSSHNSRSLDSWPKFSGRASISFSPRSRYWSDSSAQIDSGRAAIMFSRASRLSSVLRSPMFSGKRSKEIALIRKCFRL